MSMNGLAAIVKSCAFFALLALGVAQKRVSKSQTLESFGVLSRRGSSESNEKTLHRVCSGWQVFAKAHSSNEYAAKENGYNRSRLHSRNRGRIPDRRSGDARAAFAHSGDPGRWQDALERARQ